MAPELPVCRRARRTAGLVCPPGSAVAAAAFGYAGSVDPLDVLQRHDARSASLHSVADLRDRALSRRTQLRSIEALDGVPTLIPVDTCHDLMVTEPRRLAEILIERCRSYS
jgi:hypothetical protein